MKREKQSSSKIFSHSKSKNKSVNQLSNRTISILLFLFAGLLYINTLPLQYAIDDMAVITQNQFTQQGVKGIPALLTKDLFAGVYGTGLEVEGGRYRPLTLVTYALEFQFFGMNPKASHFLNILLYGLLAVVIFQSLRLMMPGKDLLSIVTTLLFIAHPIHTEVVANIKSRDEILSLLGIMLMFYFLFRYFQTNKISFLVRSCLFYFLSLLSKENGITFLVIIPMTIYCFTHLPYKRIARVCLPFFSIALVYFILRTKLVGIIGDHLSIDIMQNPFVHASLVEKTATIMCILGKYLWLLFFPHPLSCDYSYNQIPLIHWSSWKAILPAIIFLSMGIYSLIRIWKRDIIAYGFLFYIISMTLVSNIFFNIGAPMGERFEFLPSLGFLLSLTVVILKLLKIESWQTIKMPLRLSLPLAVVLILLSAKTFSRNSDWYNNETIFSADVVHSPQSAKLHTALATVYQVKGEASNIPEERNKFFQKAIAEHRKALEIYPDYAKAYYNLGMSYYNSGLVDSAEVAFRRAFTLAPGNLPALNNLGLCFMDNGMPDSAIAIYNRLIKMDTTFTQAYINMGASYHDLKDFDKAVFYYEKALKLDPNNTSIINYIEKIKEWKQSLGLQN